MKKKEEEAGEENLSRRVSVCDECPLLQPSSSRARRPFERLRLCCRIVLPCCLTCYASP